MEEKTKKLGLRARGALTALGVLLLATALALFFFFRANTLIGGRVFSRESRELDLRGARVSTVLGLTLLRAPESIDLRGGVLRPEQIAELRARFPDCAVRCDAALAGESFDSASETLTLDAARTDCAALAAALGEFPALRRVELRGAAYPLAEQLALAQAFPAVEFVWPVELAPGRVFDSDAAEISLAGAAGLEPEALARALRLFPALELLDLTGCGLADETLLSLRESLGGAALRWDAELCGKRFPTDAQEIDLSGCTVDVARIEAKLPCFTRLERVIMCECGVPDEEMDALDRRHEDVRFIWTVHFGAFFLRTDATTFIATLFPYGYSFLTNAQIQALRYCRDLTALDVGHMYYSDVSFLSELTKLKYLILADTEISDLSWAENMPELYYLEIFMTNVRDLSPLLACKNLRHLNLAWTRPSNPEVLAQMTQLERLWLSGTELGNARRELDAALVDTKLWYERGSSTGGSWRTDPAYYEMRDAFGAYYMEG